MLKTFQITVEVLLICCTALSLGALLPGSPTPVLDQIVFGHPTSEATHDFSGPGTVLGSTDTLPLRYPQNLSYRQIGADANHTQQQTLTGNQSTFITVTVRVHPSLPTYITLKMYGSDNQTGAIMLYWRPPQQPPIESLYPGMVSIGSGLLQLGWFYPLPGTQASGYGPIELTNRGVNAYPRHFHYSTSVLPSQVTANQTSLRILLGGWGNCNGYFFPNLEPLDHDLKPIYRLYTHIDPFYEPLPSPSNDQQVADIDHYEPHTVEPVPQVPAYPIWTKETQPVPMEQLLANYTALQNSIDSTITNAISPTSGSQVFGSRWNATLDIYNPGNPYATPSILWGAPLLSFSWTTDNLTRDEWLNRAPFTTTNPNNVPLQYFAALALVYQTEWSVHYHDRSILDRIVAGLDYFMYEQGIDGGMLATSPNVGWHGAPNRSIGLGSPLDGIGPYSLGLAAVVLYDDLNRTGRLDELVDYNLDGKLIRRREGWWLMFNAYIQGTFSVQERRGGCPNQDLLQIVGIFLSNTACAMLLPNTSVPLNDDNVRLMINQATGFTNQVRFPENGPFFTDTGMTMECFGINGGGGLEFNYGANVLLLLIDIIRYLDPIKYQDVHERTELAFNHYARYIYTAYLENDNSSPLGSLNNPPYLRHPTSIDTRGDYQPDVVFPTNAKFAALYHAVTHKNGYALRILHTQFMQNLWWPLPLDYDNTISLLPLWNNLTDIIYNAYDDHYVDTALLPSELYVISSTAQTIGTPDSAFVEITAAGMNIKYGQERLLVNMNYRHGLNNISGLVRLLHHDRNTSRIATTAFNSTDGFWGLWTMNYGHYFVAINRNKNKSYDFPALQYNVQSRFVLDLISMKQYDLDTKPSIPVWTAWVWVPING
jgi:hypothetical protein